MDLIRRPLTVTDATELARLYAAAEQADPTGEHLSAEDLAEELTGPHIDLAQASLAAWAGDRMIGYGLVRRGLTSAIQCTVLIGQSSRMPSRDLTRSRRFGVVSARPGVPTTCGPASRAQPTTWCWWRTGPTATATRSARAATAIPGRRRRSPTPSRPPRTPQPTRQRYRCRPVPVPTWDQALSALDGFDPHRVFTNAFLDVLMP